MDATVAKNIGEARAYLHMSTDHLDDSGPAGGQGRTQSERLSAHQAVKAIDAAIGLLRDAREALVKEVGEPLGG
jgi:hypothetical protein